MYPNAKVYQALSKLVAYPQPGFVEAAEQWCGVVSADSPLLEGILAPFVAMLGGMTPGEIEEHYCRTFDNNQGAALEVGWHIYGESYDRGAFLVHMRERMRKFGVAENRELPDHLSHVLAVVARAPEDEATELAAATLPAVDKIVVSLAADQNPYEAVLAAVQQILRTHAGSENGCS